MTSSPRPGLQRLVTLAGELRGELEAATTSGRAAHAEELRGELALLEDLALPEAVSELRLQRLTYAAASEAMQRTLPATLRGFLA